MTNVQQRSSRSNELQLLKAFKNTDVLPHLQPIWTFVVLLTNENEKYFFLKNTQSVINQTSCIVSNQMRIKQAAMWGDLFLISFPFFHQLSHQ